MENFTVNIATLVAIIALIALVVILILAIVILIYAKRNNQGYPVNNYCDNQPAPISEKMIQSQSMNSNVHENRKLKIEDIKDEDMMVAALIATVDYTNVTKKDVRLLSIREIA